MGCPLEVSGQVDVSCFSLRLCARRIELSFTSDGMHTGRYSFDLFTHFRTTLDSPGWFVFTLGWHLKNTKRLLSRIDLILKFRYPPYTVTKPFFLKKFHLTHLMTLSILTRNPKNPMLPNLLDPCLRDLRGHHQLRDIPHDGGRNGSFWHLPLLCLVDY